jgi:hypothetical protein
VLAFSWSVTVACLVCQNGTAKFALVMPVWYSNGVGVWPFRGHANFGKDTAIMATTQKDQPSAGGVKEAQKEQDVLRRLDERFPNALKSGMLIAAMKNGAIPSNHTR